jgi:hypothetical protein
MHFSLRAFTVPLVVCALCTAPSWAWDANGHQEIADITWTRLSAKAKREIRAILFQADPAFRPASTSQADVRAAFRKAATFPDVIKGNHSTIYEQKVIDLNSTWHPETDPLVSPTERERCKTWHYVDLPIRYGANPTPGVARSNALRALKLSIERLSTLEMAATKDRQEQFWWLAWVEHLTGDVHQPLHCTSSYEFHPGGDAGGNLYMIVNPASTSGATMRLHSYWDAGIEHAWRTDGFAGSPFQEVTTSWKRRASLRPAPLDYKDLDIRTWIDDGATLADTIVYVNLAQNSMPDSGYVAVHENLCRRQALLAGYRLSEILNAAFR